MQAITVNVDDQFERVGRSLREILKGENGRWKCHEYVIVSKVK